MNICFEWTISKKMNYFFEYIYILILVCLRQKLSPKNVSNSSQIIQESFIGAFSVHFRGPWPIQRPMEGSKTILLSFIGIFNLNFEWIVLLNILYSIEWIFVWMNTLDFVLNWIIFWPDSPLVRDYTLLIGETGCLFNKMILSHENLLFPCHQNYCHSKLTCVIFRCFWASYNLFQWSIGSTCWNEY